MASLEHRAAGTTLHGDTSTGPEPFEIAPAAVGAAILLGFAGGSTAGPVGALVGTIGGGIFGQALAHLTTPRERAEE